MVRHRTEEPCRDTPRRAMSRVARAAAGKPCTVLPRRDPRMCRGPQSKPALLPHSLGSLAQAGCGYCEAERPGAGSGDRDASDRPGPVPSTCEQRSSAGAARGAAVVDEQRAPIVNGTAQDTAGSVRQKDLRSVLLVAAQHQGCSRRRVALQQRQSGTAGEGCGEGEDRPVGARRCARRRVEAGAGDEAAGPPLPSPGPLPVAEQEMDRGRPHPSPCARRNKAVRGGQHLAGSNESSRAAGTEFRLHPPERRPGRGTGLDGMPRVGDAEAGQFRARDERFARPRCEREEERREQARDRTVATACARCPPQRPGTRRRRAIWHDFSLRGWCRVRESNSRPIDYESIALPLC